MDLVYTLVFKNNKVKIGRASECEVQIPDIYLAISRCHAFLSRNRRGVSIADASECHTYLRGRELIGGEIYPLKDGDVIRLADVFQLVFLEPNTFYSLEFGELSKPK